MFELLKQAVLSALLEYAIDKAAHAVVQSLKRQQVRRALRGFGSALIDVVKAIRD